MRITYKTIEQHKTGKVTYKTVKESNWKRISEKEYNLLTNDDTIRFFKRIGGSEYPERSYTSCGYLVTTLTSKNPSRDIKKIRKFRFFS